MNNNKMVFSAMDRVLI